MNNDSSIETIPQIKVSEVLPKRARGRPVKYTTPEERDQKYKETKDKWTKTNIERRYELNDQYGQRVRLGYKLLCDIWNKHYLDNIDDPICQQIKCLVENKKIISN